MSCGLDAIKKFVSGGADDAAKDAQTQIDLMQEIVDAKLKEFYDNITKDYADPHLISIKKVVKKYEYTACTYETHDEIGNLIDNSIKDFSTGPAGGAIGKLAKSVISALLGSASATAKTEKRYAITISPLGAVTRLDGYFYVRSVTASALTTKKATVVACIVVVSSVEVKDIDSNTLKVIFDNCFKLPDRTEIPLNVLQALYAQIAPQILSQQQLEGSAKLDPVTEEQKKALDEWFKKYGSSPAPPS